MGVLVAPSVGQLGSDAFKASRFEPGMESENTLATGAAPSLTTALEPGVDDHCVRRLLGVAAHGGTSIAGLPITHPLAVAADSADGGGDPANPLGFSAAERPQCVNHLAYALGIICQDGLVCVETRRAPDALRAISGIGRGRI